MRATQLLPILCKEIDFPREIGQRVDRSLFEAGLRAKGIGSNVPDLSRTEAVTFVLACMVSEKTTRAAEEVEPWLNARAKLTVKRSYSNRKIQTIESDGFPSIQDYTAAQKHLTRIPHEGGRVCLVEYLVAICGLLQVVEFDASELTLSINLTEKRAHVFHQDRSLIDEKFVFWNNETEKPVKKANVPSGIKRISEINGTIFKMIASYT